MKTMTLAFMFMFTCISASAQDAANMMKNAEMKTYGPRLKGLKDLVVDLESPSLTKQLNDQMIFGRIQSLVFRIYWTAQPERVTVEIEGMPQGFREIKEELKAAMVGRLEAILPIPWDKKFAGYQPRIDAKKPKIAILTDPSNLRPIPEFEISFDAEGRIDTVLGKKPVGVTATTHSYSKFPWAESLGVITKSHTMIQEGPQMNEATTTISYQAVNGIGLPSSVTTKGKQTLQQPSGKPVERTAEETVTYKNYKVNTGEAMRWFLAAGAAEKPKITP
jgi:hypothetical protein